MTLSVSDLMRKPKAYYGQMVTISGYLVVTRGSFSYLVDHASLERAGISQPAVLILDPSLVDRLTEATDSPGYMGSDIAFLYTAEVTGCITYTGCGLFLARLIDLTVITLHSPSGEAPFSLVLGPDLHTTHELSIVHVGANRLQVMHFVRELRHFTLLETKAFLSGHCPILQTGLLDELQATKEVLLALGATISVQPRPPNGA